MEVKKLTEQTFALAESPRYFDGGVVFTDINDRKLYRWKNEKIELLWDKEQITSFAADKSGGMVFATMHGLYRMMPNGGYYPLTTHLPMKINDMGVDPKGRIVFGTNYHSSRDRNYPLGSLYIYDVRGDLWELDYGYHLVNGIGFSSNGRKMYVCDSSIRCIFVYDYDPEKGTCGKKKILVRFPVEDGMPDGMAIDAEDCIWTAQWNGGCVIRTAPDGSELQRIPVPAKRVSAVEFTPEGLFITSARDPVGADGTVTGGGIYYTDPGVFGNPHAMSDILCSP